MQINNLVKFFVWSETSGDISVYVIVKAGNCCKVQYQVCQQILSAFGEINIQVSKLGNRMIECCQQYS